MIKKKTTKKTQKNRGLKAKDAAVKKEPVSKKETKEANIVRLPANRAGVKAKDSNKTQLIIGTITVIIILAIVYMLFFYQPYTFAVQANGITYYSNEYTPTTFFLEFNQNERIYISPTMTESGMNNLAANAMNLWLVVLAGNNITPIQLIRVQSEDGQLEYCYTNNGDVKTSEELSKEECQAIIDNPEYAKVILETNGTNTVYLEKNKATVNAQSFEVISQVNFFVMKKGFPNAEDVVLKVNTGIANIG